MRTAVSIGPSSRIALTVLDLITLLLEVAYAALAGQLILAGASWARRFEGDPRGPVATLFGFGPALLIAVGVAFLPLSLPGLLAGSGALLRKQWGRILTFSLAVLTILLGLLWLGGGDQDVTDIAIGGAPLSYGILAFVILIRKGAEFTRPRSDGGVGVGQARRATGAPPALPVGRRRPAGTERQDGGDVQGPFAEETRPAHPR
jgi:hypothetical protein